MRPVGPGWRLLAGRLTTTRVAMRVSLPFAATMVVGPRLRPWLSYHGAFVEDVDRAVRGLRSPTAWRRVFSELAGEREAVAAAAEEAGHHATAFRHGVAAALMHQTAPYMIPGERGERARELAASRDAYARFVRHAPWDVESLQIPWRGHALPAVLHLPPRAARPPPVVVVQGTIGHYKETWTGIARDLVARGVAVLAYDGPGEGARLDLAAPVEIEDVLSSVLDALRARDDVDASRAGLLGISLAGALVARAAARDHRWSALVAVTPPFDASRYAAWLPHPLLVMVGDRLHVDARDVPALAPELSLARDAPKIVQPIMVVESSVDYLVPAGEGGRLLEAAASERKAFLAVPGGHHAGVREFHRVMDACADFLADSLRP